MLYSFDHRKENADCVYGKVIRTESMGQDGLLIFNLRNALVSFKAFCQAFTICRYDIIKYLKC
jgi:hypothetical protein